MAQITTDDCKEFLVSHYKTLGITTETKGWKRISKYKEENIWYRHFSHAGLGNITLTENNNTLSILDSNLSDSNTSTIKNKTKNSAEHIQKLFSAHDVAEINKIMLFLKKNGYEDVYDTIETIPEWKKYYHAMPSQFTFNFPEGTYSNDSSYVLQGINSSVICQDGESICICFYDKNGSDPDQYLSSPLTEGILPQWMSFADEYNVIIDSDKKNLTIKDIFSLLLSLGFEYNPDADTSCLFAKELRNLNIKKEIIQTDLDNDIKEVYLLKEILKNDDVQQLQSLISKGIDINRFLEKNTRLIVAAVENKSPQCFKCLIQHPNIDIWLSSQLNPVNDLWNVVYSLFNSYWVKDSEKTYYIDLILDQLLNTSNLIVHKTSLSALLDHAFNSENKNVCDKMINLFSSQSIFSTDDLDYLVLKNLYKILPNTPKYSFVHLALSRCSLQTVHDAVNSLLEYEKYTTALTFIKQFKMTFSDISLIVDNMTFPIYLDEQLLNLKNDIQIESQRGLIMITIDEAGNEITEQDRYVAQYNEIALLKHFLTMNQHNTNKNKI